MEDAARAQIPADPPTISCTGASQSGKPSQPGPSVRETRRRCSSCAGMGVRQGGGVASWRAVGGPGREGASRGPALDAARRQKPLHPALGAGDRGLW